jgi:hypothetical protein
MKIIIIVIIVLVVLFFLREGFLILVEYVSDKKMINEMVEEKLREQKEFEKNAYGQEHFMEMKMKFVEAMMLKYGAKPYFTKRQLKLRMRATFIYNDTYYRVGDGKFDGKDYIIISAIASQDYADVGLMEEVAAFPWDLSEELLEKEVRYIFELEEYPEDYPNYEV